jgi:prepilin-type N-terminal cleavage/methylation domain-containing protein
MSDMTGLVGRLRKLQRRLGDRGYTMAEMVVVVMILGVVLAAVQTTLIMTSHTVGDNGMRIDQTQQAKVAIDSMSRVLRTAVLPSQLNGTCSSCSAAAFIQGTATSVSFYANINNDQNTIGPSRVTYQILANGDLTETIQPPNAHAPTDFNYQYCIPGPGCTTAVTRVLAHGVQSSPPMFTYYDKNGAVITDPTLTANDLSLVDSMDLVVVVKSATTQDIHGTTLTTRVTLPNADSVAQPTSSP